MSVSVSNEAASEARHAAPPARSLFSGKVATVSGSVLVLLGFLAIWEWGPGLLNMPEFILPRFSRVVQEFGHMWQNSDLLMHSGITAFEVIVGFILGALLGLVVG